MTPTQAAMSREIRKALDTNTPRALLEKTDSQWQRTDGIASSCGISLLLSMDEEKIQFRIRHDAQVVFIDATPMKFTVDAAFSPEICSPTPATSEEIIREASDHFKAALDIVSTIQKTVSAHWERGGGLLKNPVEIFAADNLPNRALNADNLNTEKNR